MQDTMNNFIEGISFKVKDFLSLMLILFPIAIIISLGFWPSHSETKFEPTEIISIQSPKFVQDNTAKLNYEQVKLFAEIEILIDSYNSQKSLKLAEQIMMKQTQLIEMMNSNE